MGGIWKTHKSRIILTVVILIAALGLWYIVTSLGRTDELHPGIVTAERKTLVSEVSVVGKVAPARRVDLAFDRSGRIAGVYTDVGNQVLSGALLVSLEGADILARLSSARADVSAAEARLDALIRGTRSEEISVKKQEVEKAQVMQAQDMRALADTIEQAYTKADDAIRNRIDQFFDNVNTQSPRVTFTTTAAEQLEFGRLVAGEQLVKLSTYATLAGTTSDIEGLAQSTRSVLEDIRSYLDIVATAVNALSPTSGSGSGGAGALSASDIATYRSETSTARTNVNSALSAIQTALESYVLATQSLKLAQEQLALLEAPATSEDIRIQEAALAASRATIEQYQADFAKTRLRAPFSGVVIEQNAEVGEVVGANTTLVSLISPSVFEIEAYVTETDIASISKGDTASVTLDAYGNDVVFSAEVVRIDPAETVIEGVATYRVVLIFEDAQGLARSGMTANVDIMTGVSENVLAVPARAVFTQNGVKHVRLQNADGSIETVTVTTGLRDSFGDIEIVSGITDGDQVVVFLEE